MAIQQVDIDTQQARNETRVVGTGNSVYEQIYAALALLTIMTQAAIIAAVVVACFCWLADFPGWATALLSALTAGIVFAVGTLTAIWVIGQTNRAMIVQQPRDENGRFIPVYEGGEYKFSLFTAAKDKIRRVR